MVDVAHYQRLFVESKLAQLKAVALERRSQKAVLALLRRRYDRLLAEYLRIDGATYALWLERGPKAELDELLSAAEDPAVWDRLVETCHGR